MSETNSSKVERICKTCGAKFFRTPSQVKYSGAKFCSRPCIKIKDVRLKDSPIYTVWVHMLERCRNENCKSFPDYGGRGITVCEEWNSSAVFIAWAEANGYRPGLQIDREKNDEGYRPDNCRFVTRSVNMRNTRKPRTGVTSKYRGVYRQRGKSSFIAGISTNKSKSNGYIGSFPTEEEAARAYDAESFRRYGKLCTLNFPDEFESGS